MGSLSNLYISQSYQSLIHFGTDNTASADLIQLQDGLGNNLGVALNTQGDISASGELFIEALRLNGILDVNTFFTASTPAYENLFDPYYTHVVRVTGSYAVEGGYPPSINDVKVGWICNGINVTNGVVTDVSGSGTGDVWVTIDGEYPQINQSYTFTGQVVVPVTITGSLEVTNDITASNLQLNGDLYVSGTIHSDRVVTTTISSSQIYSSGSNILGDSVSDTQTIVGQTTLSGSLTIDGPFHHRGPIDINGDVEITGSLKVSNDISSSTVSGIGNVELYSASVDSRLDYLEGPFSTSVDARLDYLEGPFSTSVDHRLDLIEDYTASLKTAFTASGVDVAFNGNISVVGSISAYEIHTTIESASVIFSSGSNVLGDNVSDTQTLNGTVYIPNTLFVAGVEFIPFSASVDSRIDELENWSASIETNFATTAELTLTASVLQTNINKKLDSASFESYTGSLDTKWNTLGSTTASLMIFTSSQESKDLTLATYTGSNDDKWNTIGIVTSSLNSFSSSQEAKDLTLATYTGSVDNKFNTIGIVTSSLNTFTGSVDNKFSTLATYTGSNNDKWDTLGALSSSFATTGSNVFIGNQTISGSIIVSGSSTFIGVETISGSLIITGSTTHIGTMVNSGSVQGQVVTIAPSSLTASIDCSLGNFYVVNFGSADNFRLQATNIKPGETISLRVEKTNPAATVTIDTGSIKFPYGFGYSISTGDEKTDILTFISFDSSSLYGVSAKNFV